MAKQPETSRAAYGRNPRFGKCDNELGCAYRGISISAISSGQREDPSLLQINYYVERLSATTRVLRRRHTSPMPRTNLASNQIQPEEVPLQVPKPANSKKGKGKPNTRTVKPKKKKKLQAPSEADKRKAQAGWDEYFVSSQPLVQSPPQN